MLDHIPAKVLAIILVVYVSVIVGIIVGFAHGYDGIAFVGDINNTKAGNLVMRSIAGENWDWAFEHLNVSHVVIVGDACYKGNCTMLVKYQEKFGDKLHLICGNHDLNAYVQALCAKNWSLESEDGDTLVIGLNTQKIDTQFAYAQRAIWNSSATNYVILTHEPCIDSHNNKVPKGLYKLCADLRALALNMTGISGHHHVMAHAVKYGQNYFTVGSGGGFLQECTKKDTFEFCLSNFGFLRMDETKFVFQGLEDDSMYVVYRK